MFLLYDIIDEFNEFNEMLLKCVINIFKVKKFINN